MAGNSRTGMSFFLSEEKRKKQLEHHLKKENSNESVFFKLKELHGDKSIFLGQSILALVALNESPAYSDKMNHSFKVELFASLIEELKITPEELKKELENRLEWNKE
ncbi:hypothetical protein ACFQO9_04620 [Chryseobacterium zhengzhouense]|uniref:Uncharacterized protein n=1 Tax=Chryseobacterium zhengzhouense TaxID=1636086 RepID=A0ABW2LWU7_9FLAO